MNPRDLLKLGILPGEALRAAIVAVAEGGKSGLNRRELAARVTEVVENPGAHRGDEIFGRLAEAMFCARQAHESLPARAEPAPWRQWGVDLEPVAIDQMRNACRLPVAVAGALMPDAHPGYGLPIGGVLATRGTVIPYAVGVDIACRMKMTVMDLPTNWLERRRDLLKTVLESETRFGVGATFKIRRMHDVMDEEWNALKITRELRDKAWAQLGTSGSGNHFVEFGTLTLRRAELGLEPGEYLALLSHSGSRGAGAAIAAHYSKLAMELRPSLPHEQRHLAWLDLDAEEGQAYWRAMELMGRYAAANHELIHRHVARELGANILLDVENHHNFAWREIYDGEELIVHRKGATPAGLGMLGIIPGSMGAPGFLVRGRGAAEALNSASHGAGRRMSRSQAVKSYRWKEVQEFLRQRNVTLLSAGLDEVPMAYKDIHEVMAAQADLVETLARFDPRIVKMAPAGERPED